MSRQAGTQENSDKILAIDRRARIMEMVKRNHSVLIGDLTKEFGVSAVTARSDLNILEKEGKLKRMYGGAVSLGLARHVSVPRERMVVNIDQKRRIAVEAAKLIHNGDVIAIDTGSTTLEFAKQLANKQDITVVTNDFAIAEYIERNLLDIDLVVLGGTFRREHRYTYGQLTLSTIQTLHFDKAFMGTNAFLANQGFMTEYEPEASIKVNLMNHANTSYLLMDSSKVNANGFIQFAKLSEFSAIIMDADPNGIVKDALNRANTSTELMLAND